MCLNWPLGGEGGEGYVVFKNGQTLTTRHG